MKGESSSDGTAAAGHGGHENPFATCQATLIYEWTIEPADWPPQGWTEGPFPFRHRDKKSSRRDRLDYFAPHAAAALYGGPGEHVRFNSLPGTEWSPDGSFRVTALELLGLAFPAGETNRLAIVHGTLHCADPVLTLWKLASPDNDLGTWLEKELIRVGSASPSTIRRATTVVFASPREVPLPNALKGGHYDSWPTEMQWLLLLASATPQSEYPPHPELIDSLQPFSFALSIDWRTLVHREGVAFLGLRADLGEEDPYYRYAELYVRSLYLDAVLLGVAQNLLLRELLGEVARLGDPLAHPTELRAIERRLTTFRNLYWWQVVTPHDHANRLLELYALQNRLAVMAHHAMEETLRFSEQIETGAAQTSNAVLGLLTLFGLPIGIAVTIVQTVQPEAVWLWLAISLAAAVAFGFCVAATPWGRELLRPLWSRTSRTHRERPPQARIEN
jgi:hypothetical protein